MMFILVEENKISRLLCRKLHPVGFLRTWNQLL